MCISNLMLMLHEKIYRDFFLFLLGFKSNKDKIKITQPGNNV